MKQIWFAFIIFSVMLIAAQPASVNQQSVDTTPPSEPVRLIFIHHSTGGNWLADLQQNELGGSLGRALMENNYFVSAINYGWGPDSIGDATDIPNWLDWFSGERSSIYLDALYSETDQNFGDFGAWPRIEQAPDGENQIILFKSCFPNSDLEGKPDDPPNPDGWLSVGHAKFVYNEILKYFAIRPDKLFVVITAPPLSYSNHAKNARAFNDWLVNDWLNENNYTLNNVAVFDFYNVLTGPENHHRVVDGQVEHTYNQGQNLLVYPSGDDHPSREGNQKATAEFIPMLNAFYHRWQASLPASIEDQTDQPTLEPTAAGVMPDSIETAFAENFESGLLIWEAYSDESGQTMLECELIDGGYAGSKSLQLQFDVAQDGWATCGISLAEPQNWSSASGVSMMINPSGGIFHVDVYAGSAEDRQSYYFPLDAPGDGSGWTQLSLPWEAFKRVEWEENAGQPLTTSDRILGIAFGMPSEGQGTLQVDEITLFSGDVDQPVVVPTAQASEPQVIEETEETPARKGLPFCGGAAALPLLAVIMAVRKKR